MLVSRYIFKLHYFFHFNTVNTEKFQAQKMVHLVQDLLAEAKAGEVRTELHILSLQLLHQKYQFSPHGFFNMDTKLLLSVSQFPF